MPKNKQYVTVEILDIEPCAKDTHDKNSHCGSDVKFIYGFISIYTSQTNSSWIIEQTPLSLISGIVKKIEREQKKLENSQKIKSPSWGGLITSSTSSSSSVVINEKDVTIPTHEGEDKKEEDVGVEGICEDCGGECKVEDYTWCCDGCMHCKDCCGGECGCCCNDHCTECEHIDTYSCDGSCICCGCGHCMECECESEEGCSDSGECYCCCAEELVLDTYSTNPNRKVVTAISSSSNEKYSKYSSFLGPKNILPDLGIFYMCMGIDDDNVLLNKHSKILAKRILNYLVVSCAGEARHCFKEAHGDVSSLGAFAQGIIVGMEQTNGVYYNRDLMWRTGYQLSQEFGYVDVLNALQEIFNILDWNSGSFGGQAWGKIATIAHQYATDQLTDVMFIDLVMSIAHNGGWAYGKYYSDNSGNTTFTSFLDFKRSANETSIFTLLEKLKVEEKTTIQRTLWKEGKRLIPSLKNESELIEAQNVYLKEFALKLAIQKKENENKKLLKKKSNKKFSNSANLPLSLKGSHYFNYLKSMKKTKILLTASEKKILAKYEEEGETFNDG